MSFPTTIDDFTAKTDGVDYPVAQDINELQTAIEAIETELGTDPAGSLTDVKTRLAVSLTDAGYLRFEAASALTISSGAITAAKNVHTVDTEGSAATDDLVTINGGAAGHWLILRSTNDSRDIVFKHNSGNILCAGGTDFTLTATSEFAFGYYDGGASKWLFGKSYGGLLPPVTGTASTLGFYDASPVTKQTALTTQLTTVTFTAPGTADYAIQNLTDTGGFGFATSDEAQTVLSVIANLQTRVAELETKLNNYGLLA